MSSDKEKNREIFLLKRNREFLHDMFNRSCNHHENLNDKKKCLDQFKRQLLIYKKDVYDICG